VLQQVYVPNHKAGSATDFPVGASLLAKAAGQPHPHQLTHRIREQARSHRFLWWPTMFIQPRIPVGAGKPATDLCAESQSPVSPGFLCGSEPAREGVRSATSTPT